MVQVRLRLRGQAGSLPTEPPAGAMVALRRHCHLSPHAQDNVADVEVAEGASFGECQGEAVVAAGVGGVKRAGVEEAGAVVGYPVAGGAGVVPAGDLRQGLSGEEGDPVDLAGVVGPDDGIPCVNVEVVREISHHGRGVEDDIAAGGRGRAIVGGRAGGHVENQPELGIRSCPGPLKFGGAVSTVVLVAFPLCPAVTLFSVKAGGANSWLKKRPVVRAGAPHTPGRIWTACTLPDARPESRRRTVMAGFGEAPAPGSCSSARPCPAEPAGLARASFAFSR